MNLTFLLLHRPLTLFLPIIIALFAAGIWFGLKASSALAVYGSVNGVVLAYGLLAFFFLMSGTAFLFAAIIIFVLILAMKKGSI